MQKKNNPVYVNYIETKKGHFVSSITATGKIISKRKEIVKSLMYGIIIDCGFQNKEFVKKGSVIAKIRMVETELLKKQQQLQLAEIDLQLFNEQYEKSLSLFDKQSISERELKESKIKRYKQKIVVQNIKEELVDKQIDASFDGMILNKKYNHLDRVFNGTELFTLIDTGSINIEIPVLQQDITKVYVGQQVIFNSNTLPGSRYGEVTEISSLADQYGNKNYRRNSAVLFNVYSSINTLPEDKILFGSNIDAQIILQVKDNTIHVPLESILYREDSQIVYVFEKGKAKQKKVETGLYNDKSVEIISGLGEGEKVITRGNLDVKDGCNVVTERLSAKKKRFYGFPFFR
ncbi:efflux RND transporter periplasmic adaptor subunit [candidate division KSB1 bacterium]|nr:efflux RND transporter periplasmic adaptor subunit [candidate division KSB1 bacterium]